jgi:hypothetical protein
MTIADADFPVSLMRWHVTITSQAESVSSQASSLRTGRSWTPPHIHGRGRVGGALDGRKRLRLVMRGSGSGSENKIANREPFWEPDHAANLVQPRMSTETTSAVLSVKADLPDQSERLVEAYKS